MSIKLSYKGVFLLLFGVVFSNLIFTPLLRTFQISPQQSIWIVTSISASIMLTIVVSFIYKSILIFRHISRGYG